MPNIIVTLLKGETNLKRLIIFFVTLCLLSASLVSCGKKDEGEVSVFYYTYSDTYISGVRGSMDKLLRDSGMSFNNYDANSNQTTQTEQIDTAIAKGSRLLIVNIVDTGSDDAAKNIVDKAKNADIPLPMASITKVMTVICALESIEDLSKEITVPDAAVGIEGSSVYLAKGEKVTYEMLIYSAMLESANDAVTALAICVSGSLEAFVSQMNEKAQYLSMTNTHFCNPHGLNENEHFTTARDYVKLMSYALENETFCKVIATKKITFAKLDGSMTRVLTNHNRLLNTYSGMIGGKTGFTKVSGRTLITAAKRGDTVLICITLDAPSDWNDHTKMLDLGFETVKTLTFKADEIAKELQVGGGDQEKVRLLAVNDVSYTVRNEADVSVEYELPHITFAPVKLGQELGKAVFFCNGNKIAEVPLYAESSVSVPQLEEKSSISEKIKDLLRIKTE